MNKLLGKDTGGSHLCARTGSFLRAHDHRHAFARLAVGSLTLPDSQDRLHRQPSATDAISALACRTRRRSRRSHYQRAVQEPTVNISIPAFAEMGYPFRSRRHAMRGWLPIAIQSAGGTSCGRCRSSTSSLPASIIGIPGFAVPSFTGWLSRPRRSPQCPVARSLAGNPKRYPLRERSGYPFCGIITIVIAVESGMVPACLTLWPPHDSQRPWGLSGLVPAQPASPAVQGNGFLFSVLA